MESSLVQKLMYVSSWAMASCVGMAVLFMAGLCGWATGVYDDMLGGKPLPALTQLYLSAHGVRGGYLFVVLLLVVATCAFLVHFVAARARDPLVGVWIWILQVVLLAAATAFYFGLGLVALILPMVSTCCGMVMDPDRPPAEEFFEAALFGGSVLVAIAYAGVVAVLMWKMRLGWEAKGGLAGGISA